MYIYDYSVVILLIFLKSLYFLLRIDIELF